MKPRPTPLLQPLLILDKGVVFQNTNGLQQVNTKYNIRGWLTQINDISPNNPALQSVPAPQSVPTLRNIKNQKALYKK